MRWILVLVMLVGLFIWAGVTEDRAETAATAFCDSIAVGTPIAEVAAAAQTTGDDRLRILRDQSVAVGFVGIPPFSRHVCEVNAEDGRVISKNYYYVD